MTARYTWSSICTAGEIIAYYWPGMRRWVLHFMEPGGDLCRIISLLILLIKVFYHEKILTYLYFSLNLRYQYLVLIFQIGNINWHLNSKGCDSDLSWYFYERTAICFLYLFYDLFIIDGWRARWFQGGWPQHPDNNPDRWEMWKDQISTAGCHHTIRTRRVRTLY